MRKLYGILLIFIMLMVGLARAHMGKINEGDILEYKAEKLAGMIMRTIKHEVHVVKQGGKTVAYGKIVLKRQPPTKLIVRAGGSARVHIGYEIVYGSTPSDPGSGETKLYGIVGTYIEKDDGTKVFKPLEGIPVEAWDDDSSIPWPYSDDDFKGSTTTDSNGYFEMTISSSGGEWGEGNADIYLKFYLKNSYVEIQRSGVTYYAEMPEDKDAVPEASAISIYLDDDGNDGTYNGMGGNGDQSGSGDDDKLVYASSGRIVRYVLEEGFHARNIQTYTYYISNPDPAGAAMILWLSLIHI